MMPITPATGRKIDVLIVPIERGDGMIVQTPFGPMRAHPRDIEGFIVWADRGLQPLIAGVPGVLRVEMQGYESKYVVDVDPRYDAAWVAAEIVAVVQCAPPPKPEAKPEPKPKAKAKAKRRTKRQTIFRDETGRIIPEE